MTGNSYTQFAAWLQFNHPDVFGLLKTAAEHQATLDTIYKSNFSGRRGMGTFGDYFDYVSDITSSLPDTSTLTDLTESTLFSDLDIPSIDVGSLDSAVTPTEISTLTQSATSTPVVAPDITTDTVSGANQVVGSIAAANVIQAQAARAASGLAPANVTYTTSVDPATGQVTAIPVLNTANGAIAVSASQIAPATFLQKWGLYIMLALGAFVIIGD
jgi:hypothetical protein